MRKKRLCTILLSLFTALALLMPQSISVNAATNETVILFTNDVHCGIEKDNSSLGLAELAGYKNYLTNQGKKVILADAGDALQGAPLGGLTKGGAILDLMHAAGYDVAVPGNHEFDYGMEQFLLNASVAETYGFGYISSNFKRTNGSALFDAYKMIDTQSGVKIAFVGITTPESFTKSTPTYFQDENGNYIYSFSQGNNGQDLYDAVQAAVDDAISHGADYVIALGHTGIDQQSSPWTTQEIISHVSGLDAYLDGHSHSVVNTTVRDKDGDEVLHIQTGTKMANIGSLVLTDDGTSITHEEASLVNQATLTALGVTADASMQTAVNEKKSAFESILNQQVFTSEINLSTQDPEDPTKRIIRNTPNNLGDLCADAYREVMGAEIGLMNGGGIRASISAGNVTYGDVISVFPYNNAGTLIKATGQQVLDALELSVAAWPGESGGFLHVSGITYELHSYIESSVVKSNEGAFVRVDGERRIKNVKINGEPIDVNRVYLVASHNYMLRNGGDGYSMFKNCEVVKDATIVDNELLIHYISENLSGTIKESQYGTARTSMILFTETYANKTALNASVAKARNLNSNAYTEASWLALSTVLNEANALLAKVNATQAEVDAMNTKVNNQIEALVKTTNSPDTYDTGWILGYTGMGMMSLAAYVFMKKRRFA